MRAKYPFCCNPFGLHETAELSTTVHHVRPLATHPELAFVESNLVPMCRACHDYADMLVERGIDTVAMILEAFRAFWIKPLGLMNAPKCLRLGRGEVFCHRMARNRTTKCGSCIDLA